MTRASACPLNLLAAFVTGVFVGAGLWLALILCATVMVVWWFKFSPSPPDRSSKKHIHNFGPRPHGEGR